MRRSCLLWVRGFLLLAICVGALRSLRGQEKTVVLDGQSAGRVFDGIGALSAGASSRLLVDYPEPYRSQVLDYLFKPGYGAALQHLKVEIGGDVNSTDGSEPSHMRTRDDHDYTRGYEWWLMQEAKKRNPKIILDTLAWGAPGWVGNGKFYSPDMAEYVADFLKGADSKQGLKISYTGIWNEKRPELTYVKQLRKSLDANGLSTKIVCCDMYETKNGEQWGVADAMAKDAELNAAVAVIGAHYPQENGRLTTTETARRSGRPLWSSEDQPNSGAGPILSREWTVGGRVLATVYNRNYLEGAMTKTEIWSPITSYYDILAAPNSGLMYANTPWSGHYDVQSAIWVTAHTTQFAQPGWQYLDKSSGYMPEKGTYVSLKAPDGKSWSVVVETVGAKTLQRVRFATAGGLSTATVHVWETNGRKTFEHVADLHPKGGGFEFSFDADSIYSLTTTTGQGKGAAQPPMQHGFPLPYCDDFEQVAEGRAPKYLSDQDGAFEVHACEGRAGRCLEQVITAKPIPWGPLPDPFTLAGDVSWRDYRVTVDVRFIDEGPVTVMGRIDSADVFQDGKAAWPSGYVLNVFSDGRWELNSAKYKVPTRLLAQGTVGLNGHDWHRLELRFKGSGIEALIDGRSVGAVEDGGHVQGMFGVGTGWAREQFDNFKVTPE